jgi:hypothetical protein
MNLALVIRAAGERTEGACLHYVRRYAPKGAPIRVIREAPFVSALRATYDAGIESGADYLMTVDADVVLLPGAVETFMRDVEKRPDLVERHAFCHCALMRAERQVGPRLYRVRDLPALRKHIADNHVRPESQTLLPYRRREQCGVIKAIVGLHDFGQWRRDLYRKGALYAKKNGRLPAPLNHPNYAAFALGAQHHEQYPLDALLNRDAWPACDIPERVPMQPPFDPMVSEWLRSKADLLC